MLKRSLDRSDDEGGAILVLTALLLVVLFGFAALAVDAGNAWSHRRLAYNAADLAALAAVQAIPRTFESAPGAPLVTEATTDAGEDFGARNAPDGTTTVGAPSSGDPTCASLLALRPRGPCLTNVTVEVATPSDNAFAQVIGADDAVTVGAAATAHVELRGVPVLRLVPTGFQDGGPGLRCWATNCVLPTSLQPLIDVLEGDGHIPPGMVAGSIGSDDLTVLRMGRPGDCVGNNDALSTIPNFEQGADHLVDVDDPSSTGAQRTEADACTSGHALTMPNAAVIDNSPGRLADEGIRPLLTDELWDDLNPASGGAFCDPDLYPTVDEEARLAIPPLRPIELVPGVPANDDQIVFALKTLMLSTCFDTGDPRFDLSATQAQLAWGLDISASSSLRRYEDYRPVWIHSVQAMGVPSKEALSPQAQHRPDRFSVFVLDEEMVLNADLTEHPPGGTDLLTYRLID